LKPTRWPTFVAVVLIAACTPLAKTPTGSTVSPSASPATTPNDGTVLTLSAIQRLNSHVGYIAGWNGTGGRLAKTSDSGATWHRLPVPADSLTSLRFIDERLGWAAGFISHKGIVLRTLDGGQTWQTVLAIATNGAPGDSIRQIQAVDGQRAWALTLDQAACQVPCPSSLQRTLDGGRSWTTLLHANIAAIPFASATRGWVALDDTPTPGTVEVRETSDGGTTWRTSLSTATGNAMQLDAATTDTAWLLTRDGAYCTSSQCLKYVLFRTDDGGLTWSNLGNPKDFTANCSGGHLAGPLFASPARGWLGLNLGAGGANVGPGGLLSSQDGGRTWRCATTPPNIGLLSAADPVDLWAGGEDRLTQSSALYASDDGGATWHPLVLTSLH
jgi:photosystem II stability/assembly factor-like uncharacterized protein